MGTRHRTTAGLALTLVLGTQSLSACREGADPPSEFCKSLASLNSALSTIDETPVTKATLPTVQAALTQLDAAVNSLGDAANKEFATQIDAVEATGDKLKTTLKETVAAPSASGYRAVQADRTAFSDSVDDLSKSATSSC
jgi:predicted negative regulator of RcsB-dependent stress response